MKVNETKYIIMKPQTLDVLDKTESTYGDAIFNKGATRFLGHSYMLVQDFKKAIQLDTREKAFRALNDYLNKEKDYDNAIGLRIIELRIAYEF